MPANKEIIKKMFTDALGSSMNESQKLKLTEIIDNQALTKQQLRDQIQALCEESGDASVKKYQEIMAFIESLKTGILKKVKESDGKLSPETKEFLHGFQKIQEDFSITHAQEEEQMKALMAKMPESAKQELKALGGPLTDLIK